MVWRLMWQLMEGGNVATAIANEDARMSWYSMGHNIALDVARGLYFLHSHSVLHGDLKSQNVLLTNNWTAKVRCCLLAAVCCIMPSQINRRVLPRALVRKYFFVNKLY